MRSSDCFLRRVPAIALGLLILAPNAASQSYDYHEETFLVYVSGGPSFPVGDASDQYALGWHGGFGLGFVLVSESTPSPELALKLDFTRHTSEDVPSLWSWTTEEYFTLFTLEGRLRFQNGRLFRPFLTAGAGIGSGDWFPDAAAIFGAGADIATNSDGVRMLYFELRYLQSEISFMRLDIGIRLG